ncbi:hypothetical protein HYC85_024883 [Camellia sinensis]|uniref:Uncharacterized protein n=1 Tax=Camellia sinensis TaxID=4442 RepID=A0A7J7G9X4_CAMSI|nr:hypothetical protein HYC85_024883 [Camellia sinensis]
MKPQNFSGDSSLIHESKRTIGEKFRQVYEKAIVSMIGNEIPMRSRSDRDYKCRYDRLFSREIERQKGNLEIWCGRSYKNYDVLGVMESHLSLIRSILMIFHGGSMILLCDK